MLSTINSKVKTIFNMNGIQLWENIRDKLNIQIREYYLKNKTPRRDQNNNEGRFINPTANQPVVNELNFAKQEAESELRVL